MKNINELYALPIGLSPVVYMDKIPLYGSKNLNDEFLKSLSNTKRGKIIYKSVNKMIKSNMIVPCFADSNLISFFRRRISHDTSGGLMRILRIIITGNKPLSHPLDFVLAFYEPKINKIVILINNHIKESFSVTASDLSISLALTHEMMHLYSHQNPNKFLSLFKDELNSFYSIYFRKIFKLNQDIPDEIEKIYRYFFLKVEMSNGDMLSLSNILTKLNELEQYSTLKKDKFKKVELDYLRVIKLLNMVDMTTFVSLTKVDYKYLLVPLYETYEELCDKVPVKGCAQEIIYPSEIICGISDLKIDSKIKTALQSL